jgi:hypothetical protein
LMVDGHLDLGSSRAHFSLHMLIMRSRVEAKSEGTIK